MKSYPPTSSKSMCLNFWYMMYGASLGTLNVYQKVGASLGNAIWTVSGDQGLRRTWLKGQVTLNSTGQSSVSMVHDMINNNNNKIRYVSTVQGPVFQSLIKLLLN